MDLKLALFEKVEYCYAQAEQYFGASFTRPEISFDIRGQDAGRAYFSIRSTLVRKTPRHQLKFNNALFYANPEAFLLEVVPHEVAHLVVYEYFGKGVKPHGPEWREVMADVFSLEANVRHSFDVSDFVNKPYKYSCECEKGEFIGLSKKQHTNIQQGQQYYCKQCKGVLNFSHFEKRQGVSIQGSESIESLFLFMNSASDLDKEVLSRLDLILGKKKIGRLMTSIELSQNELFRSWLLKRKILRKYKGKVDSSSNGILNAGTSHAVLLIKDFNEISNLQEELSCNGVLVRTLILGH